MIDSVLKKILFKGGTSHNAQEEVLTSLNVANDNIGCENVCTYYQGCGRELITLACSDVTCHVFSDENHQCADHIAEKIRKLEASGLANVSQFGNESWQISIGGRNLRIVFTTHSIESINFNDEFGVPLGIVYEFNCGDTAMRRSFWEAIERKLVPGGQVVGSFERDITSADRVAFVLDPEDNPPLLYGYDKCGDVSSAEREGVLLNAEHQSLLPTDLLERRFIDFDGQKYSLRFAGGSGYFITRVWRQPLATFGLSLAECGSRICRLTKPQ